MSSSKPEKRKLGETSGKDHHFLLRASEVVRPSRWVEFQSDALPDFEKLIADEVIRFGAYTLAERRFSGVCYLKHPTKCARESSAIKLAGLLGLGSNGQVVSLPGHPKVFSRVYSKDLTRVGDEPAQGSRSDLVAKTSKQEVMKRILARLTQLGNAIQRETSDPKASQALAVLFDVVHNTH